MATTKAILAGQTIKADATTAKSGLMSASDKTKLNGIATGAEVNVQSDWNVTSTTSDAFIKNKPTLGAAAAKGVVTSVDTSANLPTANAVKTFVEGKSYATSSDVSSAIAKVVGDAPDTFDTLKEIADWIQGDGAAVANIANKVDKVSGKGLSTNDYTTTEKNKLAGIAAGAEVNQNAFSNVLVGSTTIAADSKTDTLTLAAGSNITLTPNATNDKVTIAATNTNTTYSITQDTTDKHKFTFAGSDGTSTTITIPDNNTTYTLSSLGIGNVKNYDQSKAIKSISRSGTTFTYTCLDNTTGTFTQQDNNTWTAMVGATSSAAGTAGYVPAPPKEGYNTKYLRADGTWQVPPDNNTTYSSMSADEAKTGTATTARSITAAVLNTAITNKGYTTNTGTVTKVSTGVGLTGGDVTTTGTIKAKLKTETAHTLDSAAQTNTASRQYAVGVDKSGYLSLNVPWSNTTYSSKTAASGGTDVSLVTTGEKYTWNNKQNALSAMSENEAKTGTATTARSITAAVLNSAITSKGYTSNTGTITKVQANGTDVASSGVANIPAATTGKYGVTQLSSATNSTSEALAATPKAVKTAYDTATNAMVEANIKVPTFGKGVNLLTNWYFKKPVNQRNYSSYSATGFSIDNWDYHGITNCVLKLETQGVKIDASSTTITSGPYISQKIELPSRLYGEAITISALATEFTGTGNIWFIRLAGGATAKDLASFAATSANALGLGSLTVTVPRTEQDLFIEFGVYNGRSVTWSAVKVELGTVQTLAIQDGTTWILNDPPPNYQTELIKCRTSQGNSADTYANQSPSYTGQGFVPYGKELPYTWQEISTRVKAGNLTDINVGDYKTITLTTGEVVVCEVAGVDTYYRCGDSQIGHHVDFISRDCLAGGKRFNATNTNNGTASEPSPWLASELYQTLNNESTGVYSKLPTDLKPYIITKRAMLEFRYSDSGQVAKNTTWGDKDAGKLWLLTEMEVFGHHSWSEPGVGTGGGGCNFQYPIFIGGAKHIIKGDGNGGNRCAWWEASAAAGSALTFCAIDSTGNANGYLANNEALRVPLCFRIG